MESQDISQELNHEIIPELNSDPNQLINSSEISNTIQSNETIEANQFNESNKTNESIEANQFNESNVAIENHSNDISHIEPIDTSKDLLILNNNIITVQNPLPIPENVEENNKNNSLLNNKLSSHSISNDNFFERSNSSIDFSRYSKISLDELQKHPLLDCQLEGKLPIIYRSEVNITLYGLEKLHVFDSTKYRGISNYLISQNILKRNQFIKVKPVTKELLENGHSKKYLKSLKNSITIAKICEVPIITFVPNCLAQWKLIKPMKYHVGATIFTLEAALHYGWAINLGGGMHHAHYDGGGGWCVFSDIPIALSQLFQSGKISSAMIIDLDVHQSNGIARDHLNGKIYSDQSKVFLLDIYSGRLWPKDEFAKAGSNLDVPLRPQIEDLEYLSILASNLDKAFNSFKPDIVVFNAGTDILDIDPLGNFKISKEGVISRDIMIFENSILRGIPIAMVTSGGYAKGSAQIIGESIASIVKTFNLTQVIENIPFNTSKL